ncbi:TPA: hypothetical protein ACX6PV_004024 [Photobacterium damselae]
MNKIFSALPLILLSTASIANNDDSSGYEPFAENTEVCEMPSLDVGESYNCGGVVITQESRIGENPNKSVTITVENLTDEEMAKIKKTPTSRVIKSMYARGPGGTYPAFSPSMIYSSHGGYVINQTGNYQQYTLKSTNKINGKYAESITNFGLSPNQKVNIKDTTSLVVTFYNTGKYDSIATSVIYGADYGNAQNKSTVTVF